LSLIDFPLNSAAELARVPELAPAPAVEPITANPAAMLADFNRARRLKGEGEFCGGLNDVLTWDLFRAGFGIATAQFKKANAIEMLGGPKVLH
jgi:hypothetical protein